MSARQHPEVLAAEHKEHDLREQVSAVRADLVWARAYGSAPDQIEAMEERLRVLQDQHDDATRELHMLRQRSNGAGR